MDAREACVGAKDLQNVSVERRSQTAQSLSPFCSYLNSARNSGSSPELREPRSSYRKNQLRGCCAHYRGLNNKKCKVLP